MVKLTTSDGKTVIFNLKSFDRERLLCDAWKTMGGDPVHAQKRLRIVTREGEAYKLGLDDIASITCEPIEHFKIRAEDVRTAKGRQQPVGNPSDLLKYMKDERFARCVDLWGNQGRVR